MRRAEAINAADIAILCLPDAAAREAVGFIRNPAVRVIDASSAHRTQPDWVYGFPEMASGHAQTIAHARRVTNPGCYPTGAIALLRPLQQAGLLPRDYPVSIHAVSGTRAAAGPPSTHSSRTMLRTRNRFRSTASHSRTSMCRRSSCMPV